MGGRRLLVAAWDTPAPDARRAMPVNLVIFFGFALAALVLLARVLVCAAQIDNNVTAALNPATVAIASDTRLLQRLDRTVAATRRASESASGLEPDLEKSAAATGHMRTLGRNTDQSVAAIERSVSEINSSVAHIKSEVTSLGSSVNGVQYSTEGIAKSFAGTRVRTGLIIEDLAAANQSGDRILALLGDLAPVLASLKAGVASLDEHAGNMAGNGVVTLGNVLPDLLTGLLGGPS